MSKLHPLDDAARADAPGQFVQLGDGMTHYELAGPADGAPLVLVHGFSTPAFIWDPAFTAFAEAGFQVLRYDLYGRGYSDRPSVRYDRNLFHRQLVELLDALDFPRPMALAGLSMGGAIAAVFTQRRPEQVKSLLLLDPVGLPMKESWQMKLVRTPLLGDLVMYLFGDWMLVAGLKKDFSEPGDLSDYIAQYKLQMQFSGFKRALLSTIRSRVLRGASDAFRTIGQTDIPVLLIWGEEDDVAPFHLNAQLRQLIPQAEFYAIPNTRHLPHREAPAQVIPIIVDFLHRTA
jgi:pimeloyl-ACP methyl ester carboxylesterase